MRTGYALRPVSLYNTVHTDSFTATIISKLSKSTLFNEGDKQQSSTDEPAALEFPIELEFRNVGFWEGRKTGEPGEKLSE